MTMIESRRLSAVLALALLATSCANEAAGPTVRYASFPDVLADVEAAKRPSLINSWALW